MRSSGRWRSGLELLGLGPGHPEPGEERSWRVVNAEIWGVIYPLFWIIDTIDGLAG